MRFAAVAARLKPNKEVPVDVLLKNGRRRTYTLVPAPAAEEDWITSLVFPVVTYQTFISELKLASLDRNLGEYFGTFKGVLVLHVPAEATKLGLKSGDVVQAVKNRNVSSPDELMRVLLSFSEGQQFKLELMRHRKTLSIAAQL